MRIVVLTGAGISAESGLGTFRDKGGIWAQNRIEDVATPEAFARDPARVHAFYNLRRQQAANATPNDAHTALAALETAPAIELSLITQNVDGLHEAAGSRDVRHMHGQLDQALCSGCGHSWTAPGEMFPDSTCPKCETGKARPNVVWFGEIPYHLEDIATLLSQADLFAAIGTSGQVYPAAGFVEEARSFGVETVEITMESGPVSHMFDRQILGPATQTVPRWVAEILRR